MEYIVFDLEATCWERSPKGAVHEIIEIGAVRLDETAAVTGSFQTFVRPTRNPELSAFCTELTSITQEDVAASPLFAEAMALFETWIGEGPVTLLSWGRYDKNQLKSECEVKHYNGKILELLRLHRSLKHDFAEMRGIRPCGMAAALEMLGIPLSGTHHRGIDDARNIARIFAAVAEEWRAFAEV